MTHGWHTHRTDAGFAWAVYRTEWLHAEGRSITTTLQSGTSRTRARAAGRAKAWVLFFRRGGKA